MTSIFKFSSTSAIALNSIREIKIANSSNKNSEKINSREFVNYFSKRELRDKDEYNSENSTNTSDSIKEGFTESNERTIKLLEHRKKELKRNIDIISIQLKRHIRQLEYIESRISELKNEKSGLQVNKLELDHYQINLSRLSTTINTEINSPTSELASSNDINNKKYLNYQMDGEWLLIPEFKELVKSVIN